MKVLETAKRQEIADKEKQWLSTSQIQYQQWLASIEMVLKTHEGCVFLAESLNRPEKIFYSFPNFEICVHHVNL